MMRPLPGLGAKELPAAPMRWRRRRQRTPRHVHPATHLPLLKTREQLSTKTCAGCSHLFESRCDLTSGTVSNRTLPACILYSPRQAR
jgi:hypothetical protein